MLLHFNGFIVFRFVCGVVELHQMNQLILIEKWFSFGHENLVIYFSYRRIIFGYLNIRLIKIREWIQIDDSAEANIITKPNQQKIIWTQLNGVELKGRLHLKIHMFF